MKKWKKILILVIILAILTLLYARFISTRGLKVSEKSIITDKLPEDYDGFKIVQFTDLHYGSTIHLKELKNVVKRINDQNPDIIIFTGDLVENKVVLSDEEIEKMETKLKKLNPSIEILAVKGNHDYDHDYFDKITEKLNWKVLNNTYEFIYKDSTTPLVFVGFDDLLRGKVDIKNGFSYKNENPDDLFTIVLTHEPDLIDQITDDNYNVAFAGHSHLGQVRIPLIGALWTPEGSKKYKDEHYIIDDKELYVSGGIGTSSLKLRFFNKPSITLYRLRTK